MALASNLDFLYYDFIFTKDGDVVLEVKLPTKRYIKTKDRINLLKRKAISHAIRKFMDSALKDYFAEFDKVLSVMLGENVKIVTLEFIKMYINHEWIKLYYRVRYIHTKPKRERDIVIE